MNIRTQKFIIQMIIFIDIIILFMELSIQILKVEKLQKENEEMKQQIEWLNDQLVTYFKEYEE